MNINNISSSLLSSVSNSLSVEEQLDKLQEKRKQIQSGMEKTAESKKVGAAAKNEDESNAKKLERLDSQIARLKTRIDSNSAEVSTKQAAAKSPFSGKLIDLFA